MIIHPIASGSSGNCYMLGDGVSKILIDAGIPTRKILEACGFHLTDISGCLISHEHGDHASSAAALTRYGVFVYASQGTIDALAGTRARLEGPWVIAIRELESFRIGSFTVLPFGIQHDAREPLGFLIQSMATHEKILYFTDTFYLKYRFQGVNILMAECNYSEDRLAENVRDGTIPEFRAERLARSHMSLEALKDLISANDFRDLREVWLMHLSRDNSDESQMKKSIQRLTGAVVHVC